MWEQCLSRIRRHGDGCSYKKKKKKMMTSRFLIYVGWLGNNRGSLLILLFILSTAELHPHLWHWVMVSNDLLLQVFSNLYVADDNIN